MWNRPEGKSRKLFMQQQQAGNGNRVGIFTLWVGHLGSIVHQLWLHLNTRQFWCKHPPFMLPQSCTPSSQDVAPLGCWQRFTPKTPLDVNPSPAAPSPSQIGVFISRIMRVKPKSLQITNKNATNSDKFELDWQKQRLISKSFPWPNVCWLRSGLAQSITLKVSRWIVSHSSAAKANVSLRSS